MTSADAILRIRQKIDQLDVDNTLFSDAEIMTEVNAARRELARLLPKQLFPGLVTSETLNLNSGVASQPVGFLDTYPAGYTRIDGVQATEIHPAILPNLKRNLNTRPGVENKYYFTQAGKVYCFPEDSQSVDFHFYRYPGDISLSSNTANVTDIPEDINDLAVSGAFAALMSTERGNLSVAQTTRNDVNSKISVLLKANKDQR